MLNQPASDDKRERNALLVLHSRAGRKVKVGVPDSQEKFFGAAIVIEPHEVAEKQVNRGRYDLEFTYEDGGGTVQRSIRVEVEANRTKHVVITPPSPYRWLHPVLTLLGFVLLGVWTHLHTHVIKTSANSPHVADFEPALAQFTALNVPSSPEESIVPPPQDIYIPGIPPVGTIVAFAGPVSEIPDRWYLCDGRSISKDTTEALFEVIGSRWGFGNDPSKIVKLPDLRGQFLRGVDSTGSIDPACRNDAAEGDRREKKQGDGESPLTECTGDNLVGTYQGYATALPHGGFEAADSGEHNHNTMVDSVNYNRVLKQDYMSTARSPRNLTRRNEKTNRKSWPNLANSEELVDHEGHSHPVRGGDKETRPKNAAVHWIIYAGPPQDS